MRHDEDIPSELRVPVDELTPSTPGSLADGVIVASDLDDPAITANLAVPRPLGIFGPGGPARRCAAAAAGLVLLGLGVGLHIASGLGAAALDAAGVGVAGVVGVAPGWGSSILVALLVASAAIAGQRPGIGTLGVIFAVAPVVNATVAAVPDPNHWSHAALVWAVGMLAVAAGASLLVAARLGAASLEMATLALAHRRVAGRAVGIVVARWTLEGALLVAAVVLGGAVGVGTVAFALLAGPALRVGIPVSSRVVFGAAPAAVGASAS